MSQGRNETHYVIIRELYTIHILNNTSNEVLDLYTGFSIGANMKYVSEKDSNNSK